MFVAYEFLWLCQRSRVRGTIKHGGEQKDATLGWEPEDLWFQGEKGTPHKLTGNIHVCFKMCDGRDQIIPLTVFMGAI